LKILLVAGARPNFMKVAPLVRQMKKIGRDISWKLVHTGQHYDYEMSKAFLEELDIPEPDYFLNVGSGSHAVQTANIMTAFEAVCIKEKPDAVGVVGDVNSTAACALTAKKLLIKVAHVEAGLRSNDLAMPEEINRMVTDVLSDWLFVTEKSGLDNLRAEGKPKSKIHFVGNVMVDTLYHQLDLLNKSDEESEKKQGPYAVLTLHRPSNVDIEEKLRDIMKAIIAISDDVPVYFPVHPRTRRQIEATGLAKELNGRPIHLLPPFPYRKFLNLWKDSSLVLTDSGGLQEETTALGIPCFTIRENTERPVTIEEGTNTLVGTTSETILSAYEIFRNGGSKKGRIPQYWDGKASERIIEVLRDSAQRT